MYLKLALTFFLYLITTPPYLTAGQNKIKDVVPFYTGAVIPTPQNVVYSNEFIPLTTTVVLLGKEVSPTDPKVNILVTKLQSLGSYVEVATKFSPKLRCQTIISLGNTELYKNLMQEEKLPSNDQSYFIFPTKSFGKDVIILKGKDKLGLLWSVVTFTQLVTMKDDSPVLKKTEIVDYPDVINRGCFIKLGLESATDAALFAANFKFNTIIFTDSVITKKTLLNTPTVWRKKLAKEFLVELKKTSAILTPLGIEWYMGISPTLGKPAEKIRSNDEADFNAIFNFASSVADLGGNIMLFYADTRFPIHPNEKKMFNTASEADYYFVTKLYKKFKDKYPTTKILFFPPFYSGPDHEFGYPEPRDEYLKSISRLPKDIGLFWTGHLLSSTKISKEHTDWFVDITQRNPWYCQNITSYTYTSDLVMLKSLPTWYYSGFFDNIESYCIKFLTTNEYPLLISFNDFLWNQKMFNSETSSQESVIKLCGQEFYSYFIEIFDLIKYFDNFNISSQDFNKNEVKQKVEKFDIVWKKIVESYPDATKKWTNLYNYIEQQKSVYNKIKKDIKN